MKCTNLLWFDLGEQCLTLAQRVQDPLLLVPSYSALGETLWWLGEFAPAQELYEQEIVLYNPQRHHFLAFRYGGYDHGVTCLSDAAFVLWYLGYPDHALKRCHEALTLAQELSHPFSLDLALVMAAWLYQLRREGQAAQEQAEAATALSTEQGFTQWLGVGSVLRGWALAEQGQRAEGITQMLQGLAALRAIGSEIERPSFLALLAEAYGKEGQVEEGLAVLAEALAMVDKSGERLYEAELYRLRGELTLAQSSVQSLESGVQESQKSQMTDPRPLTPDPQDEAEGYFLKAIDIARKQQAKSLELRATVSLARLWQQQGKPAEAHQLLAEIYGWFTEGFDTKDLQEAKALLESLSS